MPRSATVLKMGDWLERSVTYYFNDSVAENEWESLLPSFKQQLDRIERHILRVHACGPPTSAPLRQARPANPPAGLFWFGVADVGAFYLYPVWDSTGQNDLVIVLVGEIRNPPPPSWDDLHADAQSRI